MMKQSVFLFISILFLAFLFSMCGPPYPYYCEESNDDLGTAVLSDSAKSFFAPFEGKKKVFYRDSLSKELEFNVSLEKKIIEEKDEKHGCPGNYYIIARKEEKLLNLKLKGGNLKLNFGTSIDFVAPWNSIEHREELFCDIAKTDAIPIAVLFRDTIFENVKHYKPFGYFPFMALKRSNINIFGATYKDVIIDKNITPTMCYLDKKVGIRAFRDFDNKLWVFDRFE